VALMKNLHTAFRFAEGFFIDLVFILFYVSIFSGDIGLRLTNIVFFPLYYRNTSSSRTRRSSPRSRSKC